MTKVKKLAVTNKNGATKSNFSSYVRASVASVETLRNVMLVMRTKRTAGLSKYASRYKFLYSVVKINIPAPSYGSCEGKATLLHTLSTHAVLPRTWLATAL